MKKLRDIMTQEVQVTHPDASLFDVAQMMRQYDIGAIPVCDGNRILGMITDRDIVVRAIASRSDLQGVRAGDIMTADLLFCRENDGIHRAAELMEKKQVRRLLVTDKERNLVGIVSLGDIAVGTGKEKLSGEVLCKVSTPVRDFDAARPTSTRKALGWLAVLSLAGGAGWLFLQRRPELRNRLLRRKRALESAQVAA